MRSGRAGDTPRSAPELNWLDHCMHRFFLPADLCDEAVLTLTGREAHHGLHVLRVRRGERVLVLDGARHEYHCEIAELTRDCIHLSVQQRNEIPPLPYEITLAQAIPRGKIFDAIVQKATELGTFRVVPLLTERVVSQLDDHKIDTKVEHWRMTAIEAIKQCGSPWLPIIEPPMSLQAFLSREEKFDLSLIASLQADSCHPRHWFNGFEREHQRRPKTILAWVGPEGDFTPKELAAVQGQGAHPITLGPFVLRSETAAVSCLSILNCELQAPSG
jgi:16S rRNA (uracil1498-N3)-methyltransferase